MHRKGKSFNIEFLKITLNKLFYETTKDVVKLPSKKKCGSEVGTFYKKNYVIKKFDSSRCFEKPDFSFEEG